MFEPGDWVEVSARTGWSNEVVKQLGQVQEVGDRDSQMRDWLLVKVLNELSWWNPRTCRKLTEHEIMERLTNA